MKDKPFFDRTGLRATDEQQRTQSERLKGIIPPMVERPWTARELQLLNKLPPAEIVRRVARTLRAVYLKRFRWQKSDRANRRVAAIQTKY